MEAIVTKLATGEVEIVKCSAISGNSVTIEQERGKTIISYDDAYRVEDNAVSAGDEEMLGILEGRA